MFGARLWNFDAMVYHGHHLVRNAVHLVAEYQRILFGWGWCESVECVAACSLFDCHNTVSGIPERLDGLRGMGYMLPRDGLRSAECCFFDFAVGWGAGDAT